MTGYRQDFPDSLTPEKCISVCTSKGFAYAGVQYGAECFCDNRQPSSLESVPDSDCSKECSGDKNKKCGGTWRMNVYNTGLTSSNSATAYLGCFKDNENGPRLLKGFQQDFPDSLTIQKCLKVCYNKGFIFAGLQYRVECFCGNERPSPKASADEGDCRESCSGDSSQICGGGWRMSVYETGIEVGPSTDLSESYVGCYKDQENPRYLGGHFQDFPGSLTPDRCVGLCYRLGFLYAGLQYASQCYCGDNHPSPTVKADEGDCVTRCAGDNSKICGGTWRLSIYSTSITDIPEAGKLLGCYIDSLENRILKSHKVDLDKTNTPRRCLNLCLQLGYPYSGVQYGKECFCGNSYAASAQIVSDDNCITPCSGDPSQTCGGGWRLALYRTGGSAGHTEIRLPPAPSHLPPKTTTTPKPMKFTTPVLTRQPSEETSVTTFNGRETTKGKVIFYDNFDGTSISKSKWQHTIKIADEPDLEFCVFNKDPTNSYVHNGQLVIKPSILPEDFVRTGNLQLRDCTGIHGTKECGHQAATYLILPPVQSARINTLESFTFRYGIIEIVARMPVGDWLVPELWLEPKSKVYGPHYNSGRIRLGMSRGNQNLNLNDQDLSCKQLESGVLMGIGKNIRGRTVTRVNNGWHLEMHNFTVVWTPDNLSFLVDGEQNYSLLPFQGVQLSDVVGFSHHESRTWSSGTNLAPFDTEFYISLGISAGGVRDFPDNCNNNGRLKPWINFEVKATAKFWQDRVHWLPTWNGEDATLRVDSVKVTAI